MGYHHDWDTKVMLTNLFNPLDPTEILENPSEILGRSPFFYQI